MQHELTPRNPVLSVPDPARVACVVSQAELFSLRGRLDGALSALRHIAGMSDAGGTAQVQYTDGTVEEMPVSRAIAITALEQLTGPPLGGPRMPQLRARPSERGTETPNPPRPQQTRPGGHPGSSRSEAAEVMNSITTLPIPDSTVSPLQWGTNPDPSDQNSGRVFLTVDPETDYTHIWSWERNEWLQLRLTAGEDLDLVAENQRLQSELEALKTALVFEKREVAHWKANHANRVEAARVLIERLDVPLERVDAYRKYLRALQVAQDIIEQGKGRPLPGMEVIERLIGDPKREALLAEAVDLLKWMNDNGRLLCDAGIRWRAQEVIKTYEG